MKRQPSVIITWEELERQITPQLEIVEDVKEIPKPPLAFIPYAPRRKRKERPQA